MNQQPFIKITDNGIAFEGQRPSDDLPDKNDYGKKPVQVAVHHDLSIELHGKNFSVRTTLTPDQALAIISMLAYVVREKIPAAGGAK